MIDHSRLPPLPRRDRHGISPQTLPRVSRLGLRDGTKFDFVLLSRDHGPNSLAENLAQRRFGQACACARSRPRRVTAEDIEGTEDPPGRDCEIYLPRLLHKVQDILQAGSLVDA
jgi:hypothetical protein